MFARLLLVKTLTETLPGTGTPHSYIDRPLAREEHTKFPKIESSQWSGAFRQVVAKKAAGGPEAAQYLFGPDDDRMPDTLRETDSNGKRLHSLPGKGLLDFFDLKLLFFPVASYSGVVAWVTCPSVIREYNLYRELAGLSTLSALESVVIPDCETCLLKPDSEITIVVGSQKKVVLRDLVFSATEHALTGLPLPVDSRHIAVVHDEVFRFFTQVGTQVTIRNKIEASGSTKEGALFSSEYLPSGSCFFGLTLMEPVEKRLAEAFNSCTRKGLEPYIDENICRAGTTFRLGADESNGKGHMKIVTIEPGAMV